MTKYLNNILFLHTKHLSFSLINDIYINFRLDIVTFGRKFMFCQIVKVVAKKGLEEQNKMIIGQNN